MGACQCILRCVVIKGRWLPYGRTMTRLACMTEAWKNMYRTRRLGVVGLMALIAIGVCKLVVAIDVARLAWGGRVRAGQRELRRTVVECRWLPNRSRVACLANVAESTGYVIRIRRRRKICRMALVATRIGELVVTVDMTRLAWRCRVRARQRELR